MNSPKIIHLNIGGEKFDTTEDTLTLREPDSMLAAMFSGRYSVNGSDQNGYIFIDRNGKLFQHILDWLRHGFVPIMEDKAACMKLLQEAEYFQLVGLIEELKAQIKLLEKNSKLTRTDIINRIFTSRSSPVLQLEGSDLSGVNLSGLDLSGANLENAKLYNANLEKADMQGAMLDGAKLSNANLKSANLQGAVLDGAKLTGANLGRANLQDAILDGADLTQANLGGADLRRACLRRTVLSCANLRDANMEGSSLICANLEGAYHRYAVYNQKANLCGAKTQNHHT